MKIPTSPLLLTLALSSSTLAYPTPAKNSPNPENSPLLGEGGSGGMDDMAWGTRPEKMPGRLGRRWGRRQAPVKSTLSQASLGGSAQGLLAPAQGLLAPATNIIGQTGLGNTLGNVPIVGGLVNGVIGQPNGASGGLGLGTVGQTLGTATGVVGGLPVVGGLVGGLTGTGGAGGGGVVGSTLGTATGAVSGLPIVGGLVGGLTGNLAGGAGGILKNTVNPSASGINGLNTNVNGVPGNTGIQGIQGVPTLAAYLGDGKYLTSAGQVLNLGNLADQPLVGGLVGGLQGGLGGGGGGGIVGQTLGQVTGQTQGLGIPQGQGQGQSQGLAQGQGGPGNVQTGGNFQSPPGYNPQVSQGGMNGTPQLSGNQAVRYLNINGQLIPLNSAGQIIAPDGFMHYATHPTDPTDPTPAEAFQSTTSSVPAEEGYNNPFPGFNADTDALQLVAGTMGGGERTKGGEVPMDSAARGGAKMGWEKPTVPIAPIGPTATASSMGGTRSGTASTAWSIPSATASTTSSDWQNTPEPTATPAPEYAENEDMYTDDGWGEWVDAQSAPMASAAPTSVVWQ